MKNNKKVSIVTVCLNSEKTIEKTIKSVLGQTYSDIEYIIIDGKSSDKTWDIIQKYSDKIDFFCSEPDKGIYDAMNKGIKHCHGEIIAFLNSDDWYVNDTVKKIVDCFERTQSDIVYGDYVFWYSEDEQYYLKCNKEIEELNYRMIMSHQATFFRRDLFNRFGYYDLKYKIASDYEWILKAYHNNVKFEYIPEKLCYFRNGGLCTTSLIDCIEEIKEIAEKYCFNDDMHIKIQDYHKKSIEDAKWDNYVQKIIDGNGILDFGNVLTEVGMKKKDIYLFGAGKYGVQSARWCNTLGIHVNGIIDNAPCKWGTTVGGLLVNGLDTYKNKKAQILICSFDYEKEIEQQLISCGLSEGIEYIRLGEIRRRCKF